MFKYAFIFLLFFSSSFSSKAEDEYLVTEVEELNCPQVAVCFDKNNQPYTGHVVDYDANGLLYEKSFYLNGKLEGEQWFFYENGEVETYYRHHEGIPLYFVKYSKNQQKYLEFSLIPNKKTKEIMREFLSYHPNGNLKQREVFNPRGGGYMQVFTENNILELESEFILADPKEGGLSEKYPHGKSILYHPQTGKIVSTRQYHLGKIDGQEINYYENGQIESVITYKNDKKNGPAVYYDEEGRLLKKENYVNDLLHGVSELYLGNIMVRAPLENGVRAGTVQIFQDGNLVSEWVYSNGELIDKRDY